MSDSDKWSVIIFPWQLTSPGCFRTVLWSWLGSSSWSLLRLSKVMEKILLFIEINWSSELSAVSFFGGAPSIEKPESIWANSFVFGANIRVRDLGGQVVQLSAHLRGAEPHSFQAQHLSGNINLLADVLSRNILSLREGNLIPLLLLTTASTFQCPTSILLSKGPAYLELSLELIIVRFFVFSFSNGIIHLAFTFSILLVR